MRLVAYLLVFWVMQIVAYSAFKYGSHGETGRSRRWLSGFIGGNVVGASSIYFYMKIFEAIPGNCNVAAVLANGGTFVGCQVALAMLFRSRLTFVQWGGIALVAVGTVMATLGGTVPVNERNADPSIQGQSKAGADPAPSAIAGVTQGREHVGERRW